MARVQVVSDDGRIVVPITTDDEDWTEGRCGECFEVITDRGHFEDTIQAAEMHVDRH